ncbi:MAG: hypothetical protein AAFN77_08045 [Planctomycetota bacterium]
MNRNRLTCWFFPCVAILAFNAYPVAGLAWQDPPTQQPQTANEEKTLAPKPKLIVVIGAPGADEFTKQFESWRDRWQELGASTDQFDMDLIYQDKNQLDARTQFKQAIENAEGSESIWIILMGHGTDDRKVSKFNLIGPDVSAVELKAWLADFRQPVVLVNCASSSGAFVGKFKGSSGGQRKQVIMTATKSGAQQNFTRFGEYFSQAITDPDLDLDKDEQTSLLEAFIAASQQAQDFYKQDKRLATELAILDDNDDGLGTPGDWFTGTRVTKQAAEGSVDGKLASKMVLIRRGTTADWTAEQRAKRDDLETKIEALRGRKPTMPEDEYYRQLKALMVELASIYAKEAQKPSEPDKIIRK